MRTSGIVCCGTLLAAALLVAQPIPALGAGATHAEFDSAGSVLPCPERTYTVQTGTIREVLQSVESSSRNQMFTVTDTPSHVVLTDRSGATYATHGATWFGGATNDNTGAEIVTPRVTISKLCVAECWPNALETHRQDAPARCVDVFRKLRE